MDEHPGGGAGGGAAAPRQPPSPQQHQQGSSSGGPPIGAVMVPQQNEDLPRPHQQYTIPGILHYIQHEWARFEIERAHWEVERAELQVSVVAPSRLNSGYPLSSEWSPLSPCGEVVIGGDV